MLIQLFLQWPNIGLAKKFIQMFKKNPEWNFWSTQYLPKLCKALLDYVHWPNRPSRHGVRQEMRRTAIEKSHWMCKPLIDTYPTLHSNSTTEGRGGHLWEILREEVAIVEYLSCNSIIRGRLKELFQLNLTTLYRRLYLGFLGGPVVTKLPANAGDTSSIPIPGRFYMSWNN